MSKLARLTTGTIVSLALVLIWAWFVYPPAVATPLLPPFGERPECPRHEGVLARDSAGNLGVLETIAASGPISLIPEFHDCQKLLDADDKSKFGPLVAIFAREGLEKVGDPFFQVGVNTNCTPVVNRPVNCSAVSVGQPNGTDGTERAAATIYDYDSPYNPLDIPTGWSCLYLYHAGTDWESQIFKVATHTDCVKPLKEQTGGMPLQVRVVDPKGQLVPPAARWDWNGSQHYVDIRCGTKWCEVYKGEAAAFTSSPTYPVNGVYPVKVGYDEQYLAEPAGSDDLKPGPALGTILPVAWLSDAEPNAGDWSTVAKASLSLDMDKYWKRFHFKKADVGGGAEIALCRGSKTDCLPLFVRVIPWAVNSCDQVVEAGIVDSWWAKITIGKKSLYRCVIRRKHPDGAPPPPDVVRWRWDLNDEGIWRRCAAGCCEVT